MGKVLVAILATMAALWLAFLFIGPQLGGHAFNVPHFGWGVTWTMVVGGCFLYGFYHIAKGK